MRTPLLAAVGGGVSKFGYDDKPFAVCDGIDGCGTVVCGTGFGSHGICATPRCDNLICHSYVLLALYERLSTNEHRAGHEMRIAAHDARLPSWVKRESGAQQSLRIK